VRTMTNAFVCAAASTSSSYRTCLPTHIQMHLSCPITILWNTHILILVTGSSGYIVCMCHAKCICMCLRTHFIHPSTFNVCQLTSSVYMCHDKRICMCVRTHFIQLQYTFADAHTNAFVMSNNHTLEYTYTHIGHKFFSVHPSTCAMTNVFVCVCARTSSVYIQRLPTHIQMRLSCQITILSNTNILILVTGSSLYI
jgi:hypothetical protein